MQVATNSTAPLVDWRRHFLRQPARDEPPIECREAVRLSEDALYALVDFESDVFGLNPERLGWDLYRQHGGPDGAGYGVLAEMLAASGKRCSDALWASFERPRAESDHLIIDLMDEALHYGWEAPPEVLAEIEKLRDMRDMREAQRKAAEKTRDARFYRFIDLDDAAYDRWLDDGKPDGRAPKFARWKARDAAEDETLARYDALRPQQIEMRDAAENE
jgi:hypothetical protein